MTDNVTKRVNELKKLIAYHQKRYHEEDAPEITDEVYDALVAEWRELTGQSEFKEQFAVGATPSEAFKKVTHKVRQWSFGNVFDEEELTEWSDRVARGLDLSDTTAKISYVAEHKIDGLKVILTYRKGVLVQATTRGNGIVGEDVTHTVRTIADVPHTLTELVDISCAGEVWLSQKEFERINAKREKDGEPLFANPRNAAAGTVRLLDASVAKSRNLSMFVYDIDDLATHDTMISIPSTQKAELELLAQLGFTVNPHYTLCTSVSDILLFYTTWQKKRDSLPYGIDGVVLKVNEVAYQKALGYTAKSPRYGVAFKFEAEQTTTVVDDIALQVGRTGVVTPVAHLRSVKVAGSVVARATLHNEDQINRLDVRIGDTVVLQKAGDVIPEIVSVILPLRPKSAKPYQFPKTVVGCGGDGAIERIPGEAVYRCTVLDSDFLHRQRLYHFVSKQALNVDGVGPRIIDSLLEHELITTATDLFSLKTEDILLLPGFKEKAAQNVVDAIAKARTVTLTRFLVALSIDTVGEETARVLAEHFGSLEKIIKAPVEELASVYGVGEVVAQSLHDWMHQEKNIIFVHELCKELTITDEQSKRGDALKGMTVVFTGTLQTRSRDEAKKLARAHGATVASSVSAKTDMVIVGSDAGSKADKAMALGVKCVSESEFLALVE